VRGDRLAFRDHPRVAVLQRPFRGKEAVAARGIEVLERAREPDSVRGRKDREPRNDKERH
jgi:hypothetical protein